MRLIERYEKVCPEAFLENVIAEIQSYAYKKDGYDRAPNEIYISARQYAILEESFKNPEIEKKLNDYGITMYDYITVDRPEYSFLEGGAILPM